MSDLGVLGCNFKEKLLSYLRSATSICNKFDSLYKAFDVMVNTRGASRNQLYIYDGAFSR